VLGDVRAGLPEPRLRRARRHHRRPLLRHARRHQPRREPLARACDVPVYIGDQTRGDGKVRTLSEQVALETRTRMLNPKWYEGMLKHGYEGVRQIEVHVTNTMGWSATTGPGRALGLSAHDRDLRARRGDARAPRRAEPRPPRPRSPTACSRPTSATTGSPTTRRWRRCAAPARSSKTASKASPKGSPHDPGRPPDQRSSAAEAAGRHAPP
jgi:hypothetical protein